MGVKTQRIVAANYIYELSSFCTSSVAQELDGTVLLFRNLDFDAPELLKNTSFVGEFYRGGKKIYTSILSGSLVFGTGLKENKFAISFN